MSTYQSSLSAIAFQQTGPTVSIAATVTSAEVAATVSQQQQVYNAGTGVAFLAWGGATVVADATGYPVAPGAVIVVTPPKGATNVAAIGVGTVYITPGQGM